MDNNDINPEKEQSRRDFLKKAASIAFVGGLGLFLGDKAGFVINQAQASTTCSTLLSCSGSTGNCGTSYTCSGGGGQCGTSYECSGQGSGGKGQCGTSYTCSGGGGQCGTS